MYHGKKTNRRSKAESQDLAVWWLLEYLTTPRPVTKSSANDLAPLHRSWMILFWRTYSGLQSTHKPFARAFSEIVPPKLSTTYSKPPNAWGAKLSLRYLGRILT
jgi:hypothetical protein